MKTRVNSDWNETHSVAAHRNGGSYSIKKTRGGRSLATKTLMVAFAAIMAFGICMPVNQSWASTGEGSSEAGAAAIEASATESIAAEPSSTVPSGNAATNTGTAASASEAAGSALENAGAEDVEGNTGSTSSSEQASAETSSSTTGATSTDGPASEATGDNAAMAVSPSDDSATIKPESLEPGSAVYVNGESGSDDNDGTESSPVRTFAKAKELLESTGGDTIYVSGALSPETAGETWTLDGKTLKRAAGYHGNLIEVGTNDKELTLSNIVLDGARDDGEYGLASGGDGQGGSLVYSDAATLNVGEGAVLQNNRIEDRGHWYPEAGGGIFSRYGTVNINGGTIRNNEAIYGGGVFAIYRAIVNMTSGVIDGNHANGSGTKGYGGGVCLWEGADMVLSGGSAVNNHATQGGGGISVGENYMAWRAQSVLEMTGGLVDGNTTDGAGGGIYVQAGLPENSGQNDGDPTYGIAKISAGTISNNSAGYSMFGGGGIYVNGYGSQYGYHNGELYLENAEIAHNTANIAGGGIAACPVSRVKVSLTNGAVLYGNESPSANGVFIMASNGLGAHSGNPPYEVSPSMLGGGAYRWTYDDGTEVPLNKLTGVLSAFFGEQLRLNNNLTEDDPAVQNGLSLAKVHIVNNHTNTRGGGIGTNGSVFIGKFSDTIQVSASKTWIDNNDSDGVRPSSVVFELYRNGEYVGYHEVSADDGWSTTFDNLPAADENGNLFDYTVKERAVDQYTTKVTGNAANGFTITNTLDPQVFGNKVWNDSENQDGSRPDSITVHLLADGVEVASTTVTESDGWKFSFEGIAKYAEDGHQIVYKLTEDPVAGYTTEISGDVEDGFTITNSHTPVTPPDKPDVPDTPDTPPSTPDNPPSTPSNPGNPPSTPNTPSGNVSQSTLPKTSDCATTAIIAMLALAAAAAVTTTASFRRRNGAKHGGSSQR